MRVRWSVQVSGSTLSEIEAAARRAFGEFTAGYLLSDVQLRIDVDPLAVTYGDEVPSLYRAEVTADWEQS